MNSRQAEAEQNEEAEKEEEEKGKDEIQRSLRKGMKRMNRDRGNRTKKGGG